jgi:uncharacterized OB-fold protein
MAETDAAQVRPMASFIRIDAEDRPYLEGVRCGACDEVLAIEVRRACPKCAAVGALAPVRLSEQGRLYAYTVVHRSFPGVKTPFVAALVDLQGGGAINGNLEGVKPDEIRFDMPVRVRFERLEKPEAPGERFIRHLFAPLEG